MPRRCRACRRLPAAHVTVVAKSRDQELALLVGVEPDTYRLVPDGASDYLMAARGIDRDQLAARADGEDRIAHHERRRPGARAAAPEPLHVP